ncbi:NCS1 nucleoside transporter family [Naematelia encephala]|uniref:NCS1 nucleoside transporter family n=1 Tax=Naematelia encephala TaxID=71784 RepID=A0A1Y2ASL4_9TREE|nr:NCS1 nucleoside transporter family [Naematelia encephala]
MSSFDIDMHKSSGVTSTWTHRGKRFLKKIELKGQDGDIIKVNPWINRDIVPLPPHRRTWGPWSFAGFWMTDGIHISTWAQASSLLALGLNVWQAVLCILIAEIFIATAFIFNGLPGAKWHIGFPVINRYVWGMYGSYFPLLMRILLSIVWYGTQLWWGAQACKVVIASIWPSFYTMKNTLPASSYVETNDLIALIVFWVVSFPLLFVHPEKYKIPFRFASASITVTIITLFAVTLGKAHGAGPLIHHPYQYEKATALKGSKLAWQMAHSIIGSIGGSSAGILNQADYSRFAKRPRDQIWAQIFAIPCTSLITAILGIFATSAAVEIWPTAGLLWKPYQLLTAYQEHGGRGARAGAFFGGVAFTISQLGINIAGNAMSGGMDLSGLFPQYFNIRRGAIFTAILALTINPWQLVNKANTFINVLGGFTVFLGPATGLMITDYFWHRRSNIRLSHLYIAGPESDYWYFHGFNLRAFAAWVLGTWITLPGFIAAVSTKKITVALGWTYMYDVAWPLGFAVSSLSYMLFNTIWPVRGAGAVDEYDVFGTFGPAEVDPSAPMDSNTTVLASSEGEGEELFEGEKRVMEDKVTVSPVQNYI